MHKKLFARLKKELEIKSSAQLGVELGFRSATTVRNWVKAKTIPEAALPRVKRYFDKKQSRKESYM